MLRSVGRLCAFVMLLFHVPTLLAQQVSGYAVIDGTQNPPAVVESTVDFVIAALLLAVTTAEAGRRGAHPGAFESAHAY